VRFGIAIIGVAAVAACAEGEGASPRTPADSPLALSEGRARPLRTPGPMVGVRATVKTADLAAAGLDVRDLPPIEKLAPGPKRRVMQLFTEALGVPCIGCHDEDSFTADTRRKRVAKRMYNEIVRVLELESGEPIFCDSCHDGRMFPLDRRTKIAVAHYMSTSLVGNLKRIDGRDHDCTTCHGDPPDFHILTRWKEERAPDMDPTIAPAWLPPPPSDYRPTTKECEGSPKLCPLQHFMRREVSTSLVLGDGRLPELLEEVALFTPDAASSWASIAKRGAEAARGHDMKAVKAACGECHREHKTTWRTQHRTHERP